MSSLYKLLAKVLKNKLKKVMGKVVLNSQNAFIKERQILDVVYVANEEISSKLKSISNDVLLHKFDIEKANDHIS